MIEQCECMPRRSFTAEHAATLSKAWERKRQYLNKAGSDRMKTANKNMTNSKLARFSGRGQSVMIEQCECMLRRSFTAEHAVTLSKAWERKRQYLNKAGSDRIKTFERFVKGKYKSEYDYNKDFVAQRIEMKAKVEASRLSKLESVHNEGLVVRPEHQQQSVAPHLLHTPAGPIHQLIPQVVPHAQHVLPTASQQQLPSVAPLQQYPSGPAQPAIPCLQNQPVRQTSFATPPPFFSRPMAPPQQLPPVADPPRQFYATPSHQQCHLAAPNPHVRSTSFFQQVPPAVPCQQPPPTAPHLQYAVPGSQLQMRPTSSYQQFLPANPHQQLPSAISGGHRALPSNSQLTISNTTPYNNPARNTASNIEYPTYNRDNTKFAAVQSGDIPQTMGSNFGSRLFQTEGPHIILTGCPAVDRSGSAVLGKSSSRVVNRAMSTPTLLHAPGSTARHEPPSLSPVMHKGCPETESQLNTVLSDIPGQSPIMVPLLQSPIANVAPIPHSSKQSNSTRSPPSRLNERRQQELCSVLSRLRNEQRQEDIATKNESAVSGTEDSSSTSSSGSDSDETSSNSTSSVVEVKLEPNIAESSEQTATNSPSKVDGLTTETLIKKETQSASAGYSKLTGLITLIESSSSNAHVETSERENKRSYDPTVQTVASDHSEHKRRKAPTAAMPDDDTKCLKLWPNNKTNTNNDQSHVLDTGIAQNSNCVKTSNTYQNTSKHSYGVNNHKQLVCDTVPKWEPPYQYDEQTPSTSKLGIFDQRCQRLDNACVLIESAHDSTNGSKASLPPGHQREQKDNQELPQGKRSIAEPQGQTHVPCPKLFKANSVEMSVVNTCMTIMAEKRYDSVDSFSSDDIAELLIVVRVSESTLNILVREDLLDPIIMRSLSNDDLKELNLPIADRKRIDLVVGIFKEA